MREKIMNGRELAIATNGITELLKTDYISIYSQSKLLIILYTMKGKNEDWTLIFYCTVY